MKRVLLSLILLYTCISFASIYMEQQKSGSITYSDTPSASSKQIGLPASTNTAPSFQSTPVPIKPTSAPATASTETTTAYTTFQITSPKDQESLQNQTGIAVEIKIDPELKKGDKIQLLLDNKLVGTPQASTHLSISLPDRGTHQIYAVVIDPTEKILQQSNTVTIYYHRVNTNFKPAGGQ